MPKPVPQPMPEYHDPDGLYLLRMSQDVLLNKLGLAEFQLEEYGAYDPNVILKADFYELGRRKFKEILRLVRNLFCPRYEELKAKGLIADAEKALLFLAGGLIQAGVFPRLAWVSAAIIARRGLDYFCHQETEFDTDSG